MKKIGYNFNLRTILAVLVMLVVLSGALFAQAGQTYPNLDGLFYGDPDGTAGPMTPDKDKYLFMSGDAIGGLANLYYFFEEDTMFIAVVVDSVNDNVFGGDGKGGQPSDLVYVGTSGWKAPNTIGHTWKDLVQSDHLAITFNCGEDTWTWWQDYIDDADGDQVPSEKDWSSDHFGKNGNIDPEAPDDAAMYPGFMASSSSLVWNMNNSPWDVTLNGARTSNKSYLSPDGTWGLFGDDGDSTVNNNGWDGRWDTHNKWEWSMVYEIKLNVSSCASAPIVIWPYEAHNSPFKYSGSPVFPPDTLRDLGDLPWYDGTRMYGTMLVDDGPQHYLVPGGPYFGSLVDADSDGVESDDALADDDEDGTDDEDGIWFKTLAATGVFEITVGVAGYVNAWIDWNGDGDFDDSLPSGANERLLTDQYYGVGTHTLTVGAPSPSERPMDETYYHRWRITSYHTGDLLTPLGLATDGEVEDYVDDELPLAVELTSFTAEAVDQGVVCKWTTESETENLGFILERRTQDTNWMEIASYKTDNGLLGQGSTPSYTDYSYLDMFVEPNANYEYRLADVDYDGLVTYHATRHVTAGVASQASVLDVFKVSPAYPNPFNPSTTITYFIPNNNNNLVQVKVYDITGNLVRTLFSANQQAGNYSIVWDGKDNNGEIVPAGTYFNRISYGTENRTIKMMMLK